MKPKTFIAIALIVWIAATVATLATASLDQSLMPIAWDLIIYGGVFVAGVLVWLLYKVMTKPQQ